MAIKSGRVGVRSDQVDVYGRVKGSAQMVLDDIANEYQNDVLYNVGDYVVYNSNLYKCLVANTRALPTYPIYWESVKIGNELSAQFDEIAKLNDLVRLTTTNASPDSNTEINGIKVLTANPPTIKGYKWYLIGAWCGYNDKFLSTGVRYDATSNTWKIRLYNASGYVMGTGNFQLTWIGILDFTQT